MMFFYLFCFSKIKKEKKMVSVEQTTNLSINIQIIAFAASFIGSFYKLPDEHLIIQDLLVIETIVQIIELVFYLAFLKKMSKTVDGMAKTRYYDWFITTPTMLLSTIVYFEYLERIETKGEPFRFPDFLKQNKENITFITTANFLMLLSGYLYETKQIDIVSATVLGYVFFLVTFGFIYDNYARKSSMGKKLFGLLFVIWGLYGVAFLLDDTAKNNAINILEFFAKNFFGLFLFYQAFNLRIEEKEEEEED